MCSTCAAALSGVLNPRTTVAGGLPRGAGSGGDIIPGDATTSGDDAIIGDDTTAGEDTTAGDEEVIGDAVIISGDRVTIGADDAIGLFC